MKPTTFWMIAAILLPHPLRAQVSIQEAAGHLESACVTWTPVSNSDRYHVYCETGGVRTKIDQQLIRCYGTYFRADALGLKAGNHKITVTPVINGNEDIALSSTTPTLAVEPHRREGFAFLDGFTPGAYNRDGTPKAGAKTIYITDATANTVTCDVINDKGVAVTTTGLSNILKAKGKGFDKTPSIIRMIGLIKKEDVADLHGGGFVAFAGANTTDRKLENITIEGVGEDATAYGFGFHTKRTTGIEIRNLGIMLFGDDGVSLEGDNSNIWVHHCDFFYGAPGGDADQIKGDGSLDMKYNTSKVTISFNHFWDSGKSTFAGGATEANPVYFTYHHNWFDHSDSRHPRLTWSTVHVYNNYYDGIASVGTLSTEATSAFIEANHFRNCKYPMMINMQGTNYEIWPKGTQGGGIIKAFNNLFIGEHKLVYQTARPTDFDAYLVTSRSETIPSSVTSRRGGNVYSNFDTQPTMYSYLPDAPEQVPDIVTKYAGRMNGGDFRWDFADATDDASSTINPALKSAIVAYRSPLPSQRK